MAGEVAEMVKDDQEMSRVNRRGFWGDDGRWTWTLNRQSPNCKRDLGIKGRWVSDSGLRRGEQSAVVGRPALDLYLLTRSKVTQAQSMSAAGGRRFGLKFSG